MLCICAGKLQVQSPASGLAAASPPASASAAAEAAGTQHGRPHGRPWPSQHDSADSAHLAASGSRGRNQLHSSLIPSSSAPHVTSNFATSSATESSLPLQGSPAFSSSTDKITQHEAIGACWRGGDSVFPPGQDRAAERRQPLPLSTAPEDNRGAQLWSASYCLPAFPVISNGTYCISMQSIT